MEEKFETFGQLIDELEALGYALSLPLGDSQHVETLKILLPEKVQQFKEVFVEITGENPWE